MPEIVSSPKSKRSPNLPSTKTDDSIFESLEVLYHNVAGIDIGSERHYVSVPEDRDVKPVRNFGCFTPDLEEMARWLKDCKIENVVMESTGVYWMPCFNILSSHGFNVQLVDARHTKGVPGRKTDVWDSKWLRKLHTFGFLRGCFLPSLEIEKLRTYWRHRDTQVAMLSQQTLRMHKSMEMMNIHLQKVLSDTNGVTGMNIIRSIIAGVHDPLELVKFRMKNLKHSEETYIKALTGNYQEEHLFTLKQAVEMYDYIQSQIKGCDLEIEKYICTLDDKESSMAEEVGTNSDATVRSKRRPRQGKNEPDFNLHAELNRITGVDLTGIDGIGTMTFQTIVSECGTDLKSSFPTEKHFVSWLGLAPNNQITGGKVHGRRTRKVHNRVNLALRNAAQGLHASKSALGSFYRRLRSRIGAPKALTATAAKLARLVWRLMTYGVAYVDIGQTEYEKRTEQKTLQYMVKKAAALGYGLVSKENGEVIV